jgi:two-component system, NtrC family, response regulator GlrR
MSQAPLLMMSSDEPCVLIIRHDGWADDEPTGSIASTLSRAGLRAVFRSIGSLSSQDEGLDGTLNFHACIARVDQATGLGIPVGILLKGLAPGVPIFALVPDVTVGSCELAARHGADHVLSAPHDWQTHAERIKIAVSRTGDSANPLLVKRGSLITSSAAIANTLFKAERLGTSGQSILVTGPTGAGKELLAQVIGKVGGPRPVMSLNCAAMPESLMEAELFGYAKGAFSGATKESSGLIMQADGGVLFLDEVGELSPTMQAKLLRVLDTGEVRALGGKQVCKVNFQLVCATHRNIEPDTSDSGFRQDLYYRIASVKLSLPALDERKSDVALLAQYFAATQSPQLPRSFTSEALRYLQSISWPGNVRELRNFVGRCSMLNSATTLGLELVQKARLSWLQGLGVNLARDAYERDLLLLALEISGNAVSEAAKLCNKNRTEMYRLINRYGIETSRMPL